VEVAVPRLTINDREHEYEGEGRNLLEVCLALGYDVPYFCWHPAMHSVGACRQCAVKQFRDANDTRGRIVMACMTPASDGTIIATDDPEAVAFRQSVAEWLMVNHPHDCPVCDEGGECHLQDMTVLAGHNYRRYRFTKRTHRNQDLGPFLNHEMNRCIQCYRCTRFYRGYAGGRDFGVTGWHDHVYFGRHEDGPLQSEFSGNLVEVCPTGVFTDKTAKTHYTRKWDLQTAPSICVHCGLGCNTIAGERYGTLRGIRSRFSDQVNGYFLCDRGRFGYEFVNSDQRLRRPLMRNENGELEPCSTEEALWKAAAILQHGKVIGIGSPRASLEANFTLQYLVDAANYHHGMAERTYQLVAEAVGILRRGPARAACLQEIARDDAVLLLGEDVTNTAPMLGLALRQTILRQPTREALQLKIHEYQDSAIREAIQVGRGPLYIATPDATKLDDETPHSYRAAPPDIARFGFAVAHALDPEAPGPPDLPADVQQLAEQCAAELLASEAPAVVSGFTCGHRDVIRAAANVAWALERRGKPADLLYTVPECNSMGVGLLGGLSLNLALQAVRQGDADTVVILENDLTRQMDVDLAHELLERAKHVIVLDHLPTPTTDRADLVFPAATFAESTGTLVNNEGRGQRFLQVFVPEGQVRGSWQWLGDLMVILGKRGCETWCSLEAVMRMMAETVPALAPVPEITPRPDFRLTGQKIARQPHRYSGRTAVTAHLSVHEPRPPADLDTPLAYSMEGHQGVAPPALNPRYWAPGWNSNQAVNRYQTEIGGPLRGEAAGRRLIEPDREAEVSYFTEIPAAFTPREDALLIMPDYLIFGSEPLSMASAGIAARAPEPYLGVSPADMERLGVAEGEIVALLVTGTCYHLPVMKRPPLPRGVAMLPAGLGDMSALSLPQWGHVEVKREVWD
jgi:NADH-quinone oxidoreductase subunit G